MKHFQSAKTTNLPASFMHFVDNLSRTRCRLRSSFRKPCGITGNLLADSLFAVFLRGFRLAGFTALILAFHPRVQADPVSPEWRFTSVDIGSAPGGTPLTTALKGLIIQVGSHREATVCYDLDLCRLAGVWTQSGSVGIPAGEFPVADETKVSRSPGEVAFTTGSIPGFVDSAEKITAWKDPRPDHAGPLSDIKYRGMHVVPEGVVLEWEQHGLKILEKPGYLRSGKVDRFVRQFEIEPHTGPLLITLCRAISPEGNPLQVWTTFPNASQQIGDYLLLRIPASTQRQSISAEILASSNAHEIEDLRKSFEKDYSTTPFNLRDSQPAHWPESIAARSHVSLQKEEPYVVDTIGLPEENPWHAAMLIGGFDFFADGRAAVCTTPGDIYIVSGIDGALEHVAWRRFAAGLFQPFGLKIIDDDIYVTCRDGVTRFAGAAKSTEATFYERFNNDLKVTRNPRDIVSDLQVDPAGNFYFTKAAPVKEGGGFDEILDQHGTLLRLSPDGKALEIFATGFCSPGGLGMGPNGEITVSDLTDGKSASRLNWVEHFEHTGYFGCAATAHRDPPPEMDDGPLCWIPHRLDPLPGSQVWVPESPRWGPWRGELLHVGDSSLFGVLKQQVEDPARPDCCDNLMQGGVVRFPFKLLPGLRRARFNPVDGQLYVAGFTSDGASSPRGCFQRVRYTGADVHCPLEMNVQRDGIEIRFSCSIDTQKACDTDNWTVETWDDPTEAGGSSKKLSIETITAGTDDRSVFLEIQGLKVAPQISIQYRFKAADDVDLRGEIVGTIHGFDE